MNLTSERLNDFAALAAVRDDWRALSARIPENTDVFATWDYTWSYLKIHQPNHWEVIAIRAQDSGVLVAVFALQVFQIQGQGQAFRACQPLGTGYTPYIEFPIDSAVRRDVLQLLLNTVLQQQLKIDVALFWPLHQASPLYLTLLEDLGRTEVLKTLRLPGNLHEIETRGVDWAGYVHTCTRSVHRDASYKERRLSKEGEVLFTLSEPSQETAVLVATLCQQNQAKFGQEHAYRHLPKWATFLPQAAQSLTATGLAQVSTLRLNGAVLAGGLSYLHKKRRYFYLFDYDPAFVRFSPAKILLRKLIEQTFREGGVFCFGAGGATYKRDWGPSVGELKAALVFFNPIAQKVLQEHLTLGGLNSLAI